MSRFSRAATVPSVYRSVALLHLLTQAENVSAYVEKPVFFQCSQTNMLVFNYIWDQLLYATLCHGSVDVTW